MSVDVLCCAEVEQLFHALSKCKASQTLERIDMESRGPIVPSPSGSSLTAITPLFCFTQLRTLQLDFRFCCFNLDDDLLLEAMSSWPHILSLKPVDMQMEPTATFRGLIATFRLCPHLHTLHMLLDATNIDIDIEVESFQHTTLQKLDLSGSRVVDAEAVARIIFSMLPCIDRADRRGPWRLAVRFQQDLDDVNRHLETFKSSAVLGHDITGAAAKS